MITNEECIKTIINKYIEDINMANKDELYAIFEIINKQYKETGECPICSRDFDSYNNKFITMSCGHFGIYSDNNYGLSIQANYCPICGKSIK